MSTRIDDDIQQPKNYDYTNTADQQNLNHHRITALVICGPSGSGKTTLLGMLLKHFHGNLKFSVSHTTRPIRPNETDGKSYYFIDHKRFEQMIANNEFIEYSKFSNNYYGTSVTELQSNAKCGQLSILDVDLRGVINLQKKKIFKAKYIFIRPPSLQFLEQNLRKRGTETDETIAKRLEHAKDDLKLAEHLYFDLIIENIRLDESFETLRKFVQNELNEFHSKSSQGNNCVQSNNSQAH